MKRNNKKGFTIVELVIVIAIIAILAAVLIPTFSNLIKRANVSKDNQLVRNLNTALIADAAINGKHETMQSALDAVAGAGFLVDRINKAAAKDNEILWDSENDVFCYLNDSNIVYIPSSVEEDKQIKNTEDYYKLWKIYDSVPENQTYSIYLSGKNATDPVVVNGVGFDAGENIGIKDVTYTSSGDKTVKIRTNGGKLTIGTDSSNVAKGQIYHYGVLDEAIVYTETSCFHTHGAIGKMELKAGKAIAEAQGIVYLVEAVEEGVAVEEKDGGKFFIPAGLKAENISSTVATSIGYEASGEGNTYVATTSKAYEIGTLAALKTFRDMVNGGFSFQGCVVKLTADIKLDDGWTPIGEGNRSVGATNYPGNYAQDDAVAKVFKGEFDGGNHTISNLNNKGYVPRFTCEVKSGGNEYQYSFGFFGILYGTANVHNLKFANVEIDTSVETTDVSGNTCVGDSIAALAGFCDGNVTISDITVESGTIKATDAAAGIVGRWYRANGTIALVNLVNKADITVTAKPGKAAGLVGYTNAGIYTFTACKNKANISATNTEECYADYFMCYANFGQPNSTNKAQYTFDDDCTAEGTVTMRTENSEKSNKYGVWRWTHQQ